MSGEIEVHRVFTVKGRGAVVIGYLRLGTVRPGQQVRLPEPGPGPPRVLTLAAVEPVHAPDGGGDALGLVFRERPSLEAVRSALAAGARLRFEDAAS